MPMREQARNIWVNYSLLSPIHLDLVSEHGAVSLGSGVGHGKRRARRARVAAGHHAGPRLAGGAAGGAVDRR